MDLLGLFFRFAVGEMGYRFVFPVAVDDQIAGFVDIEYLLVLPHALPGREGIAPDIGRDIGARRPLSLFVDEKIFTISDPEDRQGHRRVLVSEHDRIAGGGKAKLLDVDGNGVSRAGEAEIHGLLQSFTRMSNIMERLRVLVEKRRGCLRLLGTAFRRLGRGRLGRGGLGRGGLGRRWLAVPRFLRFEDVLLLGHRVSPSCWRRPRGPRRDGASASSVIRWRLAKTCVLYIIVVKSSAVNKSSVNHWTTARIPPVAVTAVVRSDERRGG